MGGPLFKINRWLHQESYLPEIVIKKRGLIRYTVLNPDYPFFIYLSRNNSQFSYHYPITIINVQRGKLKISCFQRMIKDH